MLHSMKGAIKREMYFGIPFAITLYRDKTYFFNMFVEVAITEGERKKVVEYARAEKIRMERGYAELIREGLKNKGLIYK